LCAGQEEKPLQQAAPQQGAYHGRPNQSDLPALPEAAGAVMNKLIHIAAGAALASQQPPPRPPQNVRCIEDSFGNVRCSDGTTMLKDSFGNWTIIKPRDK
jgi:hypothetical protein